MFLPESSHGPAYAEGPPRGGAVEVIAEQNLSFLKLYSDPASHSADLPRVDSVRIRPICLLQLPLRPPDTLGNHPDPQGL